MSRKNGGQRVASEIVELSLSNESPKAKSGGESLPDLESAPPSHRRLKMFAGIGITLLVGIGVFAANGWLAFVPESGAITTGLPTFAQHPPPPPTLSHSKDYIYAGSRLLAVEDANAGGSPTPTPAPSYEATWLREQAAMASSPPPMSPNTTGLSPGWTPTREMSASGRTPHPKTRSGMDFSLRPIVNR